jgi:hypothetical protein
MAKTKSIEEREAFVEVSRTVLGKTKSQSKRIKIRPFVTSPATVSVKFGATIPTGDYASARVDVMISAPCYVEEVPDMYETVRDLCDRLVDREVGRLTGEDQDDA